MGIPPASVHGFDVFDGDELCLPEGILNRFSF
jgi:hypothetical protein